MHRLVKILAVALASGLALAALLLFGLARVFDAGEVREYLNAEVQRSTGRSLVIGSLDVRLFPEPRAVLHDVRLGNGAGFGDEPFASIEEARVGLRLLPLLLHRALHVEAITVHGLQINLLRRSDGSSNWADFGEPATQESPSPSTEGETTDAGAPSLALAALVVDSASLRFRDERAGSQYAIDSLSLRAEHVHLGEPFDVSLSFASAAAVPAIAATVTVGTRLLIDPQQRLVTADALRFGVRASQGSLRAAADVSGRLRLDLRAQQLTAEKLQAGIELEAPEIPGAFRKSQFEGDAIYDATKGSLRVGSAEWRSAGISVNFAIDGSGLDGDSPRFSGPLIIKPFKPRELLAELGLTADTRDPAALKEASFRARIEADASTASVRDLVVKVDQSTLTGSAELPSWAPLAVQFALKLDTLDLDRYRAPPGDSEPASAAATAPMAEPPLALDRLDRLSASGTLDIGKLALAGLRLSALKLRLDAARGQDKRLITTASLYGGSLSSSTHLQRGASGRLAESLQLNAVALEPLLADLGRPQALSGQGNILIDLASHGATAAELKRKLAGDISVDIADGTLRGLNVAQSLRHALSLLRGEAFSDVEPVQTDFSTLAFKGRLADRQLRWDEFDLRSTLYRIEGAGRLDLDAEVIDGVLKATVPESLAGQTAEPLSEIAGLSVPLRVSGPWAAPRYTPDLRGALQQKAAERLRERLGQQLERKLGDGSLKDRLQHGLDSLFGRSRKAPPPDPAPAPVPVPGIL